MAKCTAHSSQTGQPCRNNAIEGATVCRMHGGSAPQVRQKARQRLLEAVDPLMAELIRLALHGESESVRVAATKDALDRAGLNPKMLIESEVTIHDGGDVDREIARLAAELAERAEGRTPGGTPLAEHSST